ncbi:NERD domain-containing protein [Rhodococcus jostii]|uniref:NERD domain-containing protein n=1 Tax=Rhodococcus jostii TaxID=132919 RepID=UPI00362CE11C
MLRGLMPSASPYRAWTNFEFMDNHGQWHEVDALVLGRRRLHLVELKHFTGLLRGTETSWVRTTLSRQDPHPAVAPADHPPQGAAIGDADRGGGPQGCAGVRPQRRKGPSSAAVRAGVGLPAWFAVPHRSSGAREIEPVRPRRRRG